MFKSLVFIAAAGVAAVSAACTAPYGTLLGTNPVTKPDSTDYPTIGVPYTITWDGSGWGPTVKIILLRGPSTTILDLEDIISGAPNTGTYSWTPESSLTPDTTHYGLRVVDESTCNYQYSTQFGLHEGSVKPSSAVSKPSSVPASKPSSRGGSKPSDHPEPSGYAPSAKPSSGPPPPAASSYPHGGDDGEDCDDEGSPYPSSKPSGGYTPYNSTYTNTSSGASPSYTPLQSNDATSRFAISAFGAIVAFAAAIMVV